MRQRLKTKTASHHGGLQARTRRLTPQQPPICGTTITRSAHALRRRTSQPLPQAEAARAAAMLSHVRMLSLSLPAQTACHLRQTTVPSPAWRKRGGTPRQLKVHQANRPPKHSHRHASLTVVQTCSKLSTACGPSNRPQGPQDRCFRYLRCLALSRLSRLLQARRQVARRPLAAAATSAIALPKSSNRLLPPPRMTAGLPTSTRLCAAILCRPFVHAFTQLAGQ